MRNPDTKIEASITKCHNLSVISVYVTEMKYIRTY